MQILSYSPSCEAYAECGKDRTIIDLSPDIVSMQVNRHSDNYSSFSLTLQNKGWKYNGLFTPMDRIILFCTKNERIKLFSGYITDCTVFSLYQGDISISGKCTLYRIQQTYWDPGLEESQRLLFETRNTNANWSGFHQTITDLLTKVGGWSEFNLYLGAIPQDAISFAHEMYDANLNSRKQLKSMVNDFYELLSSHGPVASGHVDVVSGTGGNSTAKAAKPVKGPHKDGADYFQVQENGFNCGATSVAVGINIMLGLKGSAAYDDVAVWHKFGDDTTFDMTNRTIAFLANEGLNQLQVYSLPGGENTTSTDAYRSELQKGNVIVSSSGQASIFQYNDGRSWTHGAHWILFYNYSNGTFFANDSSAFDVGAGCPYSESDLQQWLNGRAWHCAFVIAPR